MPPQVIGAISNNDEEKETLLTIGIFNLMNIKTQVEHWFLWTTIQAFSQTNVIHSGKGVIEEVITSFTVNLETPPDVNDLLFVYDISVDNELHDFEVYL